MDDSDLQDLARAFREMSVTDPRATRTLFLQALAESPKKANDLLGLMGNAGDGRVRQLIATSVRGHADFENVRASLEDWLSRETDEFARRAIQAAVGEEPTKPARQGRKSPGAERDAYRYLSDRMKHEVRNGLYGPKAQSNRLKQLIQGLDDPGTRSELLSVVASLDAGLVTVGRLVEFQADDEAHFLVRPISVAQWLREMNKQYLNTYGQVGFAVTGEALVLGSDYLLRLIFWNQWTNAHSLLGAGCRISVAITPKSRYAALRISDSGPGYEPYQAEMMFANNVSKEAYRGRGLQEVYDAVLRLQGTARTIQDDAGAYRLEVSLPMARA